MACSDINDILLPKTLIPFQLFDFYGSILKSIQVTRERYSVLILNSLGEVFQQKIIYYIILMFSKTETSNKNYYSYSNFIVRNK